MAKKTFILILSALVLTFAFTNALRYFKPKGGPINSLDSFPMKMADWQGKTDLIPRATIDMLNPDELFSATYTNSRGLKVQLFFDYFSTTGSTSGIHSPRNCLPGSGWAILDSEEAAIDAGGRLIKARRFHLRLGESRQVMDFWYITRNGETANDFKFKLHTMLSSLKFEPTDVAFIRFVALDNPDGLAALGDFEKTFVPVIYQYLDFN